jgi:prefoldin subunit 5
VNKKQRIARLAEHLEMLQDEAKAVEEHIARIRKEK